MNAVTNSQSIIIEASAGSGKTYQLINHLVVLLLNGANPANIVAITFTRKAASEMQSRLQERLYTLATVNDVELHAELESLNYTINPALISKARSLYEEVLFSPQSVRCTTFHSFCQEILKRFPFEAEVPPGFELSEQTYLFKQQAWSNLMDECEQGNSPSTKSAVDFLFNEFGLNTTKDLLNNFINQRSDWWAWTQHANNPVGLAISKMQDAFQVDPTQNPIQDFFEQETLEKILDKFIPYLLPLKAAKYGQCAENIGFARDIEKSFDERLSFIRMAFLTAAGTPRSLKASNDMKKLFGDSGTDDFISIHVEMCRRLEELTDAINLIDNYNINKQWYIAGAAYLTHYQQTKFSLRQLDFTDLEWQTYCLLTKSQHALWVQYKLDSRIDHLLIDEFQDTNPIQWRLLQPLIEEFNHQQHTENDKSVLLVGDTKQSIYRFRRAEPKLFPIASSVIDESFNSTRMQLNSSWRSSPAVINFVNKVFSETVLGNAIGDFPLHQTQLTNLSGCVTLLEYPVLPEVDDNEKSKTCFRNPLLQPRLDKINIHQIEAEKIAEKIHELINSDTTVTVGGLDRNIQFQDIIILLRNRTHAADYEKALHKQHIPFVGSERGTLLECLEVSDIIMLLNWLITPFNNVALASILRSPLFSISDETLIKIAQVNSKIKGQSNWFNKIEYLATQKEHDSQLKRAVSMLSHWKEIATLIPVHDLLDVIYNEADVLKQYYTAYPAHLKSRTQANLTRLIELALEIDSGRYPSLQQFIAHIQHLKTLPNEAPDTPAASSDKNRVQVMTIHASKGLEAPVIFMANADAGNDDTDKYTYKPIIDWPAEQEKPNLIVLSNNKKRRDKITASLLENDSLAQQRETANLFYVAITRARQYLFISAAKQTKSETDWYSLIGKCYSINMTDKKEAILEHYMTQAQNNIKIKPITSQTKNNALIDSQLNNTIKVNTIFNNIEPSISPSQISEDNNISKNKSNESNTQSDATNRGIIIHAILESINNNPLVKKIECKNTIGSDVSNNDWDEYWNEVQQVLAMDDFSFIFDTKKHAYNEVSISYLDNGVTVYGIIDRLVISDEIIYIIDYKTHQTVNSKNITEYSQRYQAQLAHYQQAAQRLWPTHKIQSYLLFTHSRLLHQYI